MKNPNQAAWSRTTGWAVAVALAATLVGAPSIARAVCVGDCSGDNEVTVNELIIMVNIALETAPVSTCMAGDADGDGFITVNEIVAGVNNALNGCPPPMDAVCGNGDTETGEDCDNGGICIGGTNAGTVCDAEADCQGEGICDTFGQQGDPGTVVRKVCSNDTECGGAKCIHCKTFGGDGCAANCSTEAPTNTILVPGALVGIDLMAGTSGAIVHGDILTIPLPLVGTSTLIGGKEKNGRIPIAQAVNGTALDRIAVSTLACACVRGSEFKTCGGTQFEADGTTVSTNCTANASLCTTKPCTAVAGPGNAGEGVIGCTALPASSYSVVQNASGPGGLPLPAVFTYTGGGGPGSQVQATGSAIGTIVGLCTGTAPDYGPDGQFCTDDDAASTRGTPSIQTLVSGTASATVLNANDLEGNDIGPFEFSGSTVTCAMIAAGNTTGASQAGAFTSLDQPTLGDIAVRNVFVSQ